MASLGRAIMASTTPAPTGPPTPAQLAVQGACDQFTTQLQTLLHHDRASLAQGLVPTRAGEPLSADQQAQLDAAGLDFLKSLPLGAFAPQTAARLQDAAQAAGLAPGDVATTRLGDLGALGNTLANGLLQQASVDSPEAAYGLAAGLAAAAGYVGWTKGSEGLTALGIKPEVQRDFFDGALTAKLGGEFGARFAQAKVTGTLSAQKTWANGAQVSGSVTGNTRTGFDAAQGSYALTRGAWSVGAQGKVAADGTRDASLTAGYQGQQAGATVTAQRTADGLQTVKLAATAKPSDTVDLGATVERNVPQGLVSSTASLEARGTDGQKVTAFLAGDSAAGLTSAKLGLTLDRATFSAAANAEVTPDGLAHADFSTTLRNQRGLEVGAQVTANLAGVKTVGANLTYAPGENLKVSARVARNLQTGQVTGGAELSAQLNGTTEIAAQANVDTQGQSSVSVGLKGRF